ncbi:MAG: hypothetical protein AB1847_07455 [bacterium]
MAVFLFWNLNNKPLQETVGCLAARHEVDVLMFAECAIEPSILLNTLNQSQDNISQYYYARSEGCEKIKIFTRFTDQFIQRIYEEDRLTIRHLKIPELTDILIAVIHFSSKLHWCNDSQSFECVELARTIKEAEEEVGHSRTVLIGDFNMNPFESGVVSANGLHAVMSRYAAKKKTRVVNRREYPFFYNPMWSLFGDMSPGPPGTYYFSKSVQKVFFWNMFDQVLIRPDLLDLFSNEELKILDSDGNKSLLSSRGVPDAKVVSDHLPILFKLKL